MILKPIAITPHATLCCSRPRARIIEADADVKKANSRSGEPDFPPPLSPSIPKPPLSPFFPLFFLTCKPLPPPKCNVAHHCTVAVKIVPFYRARGRANEGRARARAHSQCEALPRLLKASYYCALVFRPLSLSWALYFLSRSCAPVQLQIFFSLKIQVLCSVASAVAACWWYS